MAKLREASLMEGKFFIEMGQLNDGTSGLDREREETNGGHIKTQDGEGDSDDEEETRGARRFFANGDETLWDEENSQVHRDSGIDSFFHVETGTPGDDKDDENDKAFRQVVYSKRRRGSRVGAGEKHPESWSPNAVLTSSTPNGSERNKSDADGSETEVTSESTTKQKKKRKKKNKKRAAAVSVDEHCVDDWDQLDLVDDEDAAKRMSSAATVDDDAPRSEEAPAFENGRSSTSESSAGVDEKTEGDEVFEERTSSSYKSSLSESYDHKAGIKSILKNRSRTFSGESSCSEAWEYLPSSAGDKRGSFRNRKDSTSLTSVTQSLESLSITSMPASDSCCEDSSLEDRCDDPQMRYCASWSSGNARKSVHFSAVIDRKRFRSGAPPQNVGKGRRNSGGGKPNQPEHGKKRHLSEGDASTTSLANRDGGTELGMFDPVASSKVERASGRDSPNGDQVSVSSDDLFHMEELDEVESEAKKPTEITGDGFRSLLGVLEEREDDEDGVQVAVVKNDVGRRCGPKGSKKGKKNKSKRGKGNPACPSYSATSEADQEDDGWSTVGGTKLGKKKNGSRNSSDLSLSDVDDGHSIYITDGASDFGAISIMDFEDVKPNGQNVS